MFRVAEGRWKITMEPHRAKGRWEDSDSDSDYTQSGDEEETNEEKEKVRQKSVWLIVAAVVSAC